MAMIDIGIEIEITASAQTEATATVPTTSSAWQKLKDCVSMPALIQPGAKIPTDYIGDAYTSEIAGKKALTALDFVFAYDGGKAANQFRILYNKDANKELHFLRVTYPDGTSFTMLVALDISLVQPTPSGQLQYTCSVSPRRSAAYSDLIQIAFPTESSGSNT